MKKKAIFHAPDSQYWDIRESKPIENKMETKNLFLNQAILTVDPLSGETTERHRLVRTSANYRLGMSPNDMEHDFGPSQTIPEHAMSIQDILHRASRGLPVKTRTPIYSDDDFPDLNKLDIAEKQELFERNQEFINKTRTELNKAEETKRKNAIEAKNKKLEGDTMKGTAPAASPPTDAGEHSEPA